MFEVILGALLIDFGIVIIALLFVRLRGKPAPSWVPLHKLINRFVKWDQRRVYALANAAKIKR